MRKQLARCSSKSKVIASSLRGIAAQAISQHITNDIPILRVYHWEVRAQIKDKLGRIC